MFKFTLPYQFNAGRKVRLPVQVVEGGHAHARNRLAYHHDTPRVVIEQFGQYTVSRNNFVAAFFAWIWSY